MGKIDINCDVGEGVFNEDLLLKYIQSCNIACGGHTGDAASMRKIVSLALNYKLKIGAHPSYPDIENFGRKSIAMEPEQLIQTIEKQLDELNFIVKELGGKLHHIKPHGALYNDIVKNKALANVFLIAIEKYKETSKLYVPYGSEIEKLALKEGFQIVYEAFADRNYNDDLSLVSRKKPQAVITAPEKMLQHVQEIYSNGKVTTLNGKKIKIKATTFCVHSDTENAVEMVKVLNEKFS